MKPAMKDKIANATVKFLKLGGQGVVVRGGLILTAAHVIHWDGTGEMGLDAHYLEQVEIGGQKFRAEVLAVEPVTDIAVLGSPDDQYDPEGCKRFDTGMATVEPVKICTEEFPLDSDVRAHVLAHTGEWLDVTVNQHCPNASWLWFTAKQQIEGGTSGSPVVSDDGLLLGLVSFSSEPLKGERLEGEPCEGRIRRPHLVSPVWLAEKMIPGEDGACAKAGDNSPA
jgi:hypothetical protein